MCCTPRGPEDPRLQDNDVLHSGVGMVTFVLMSRVRHMTALLLLALWLPATFHCLLEVLDTTGTLACAQPSAETTHHHQESDCDYDGCSVVEGGWVWNALPASAPDIPAALWAALVLWVAACYVPPVIRFPGSGPAPPFAIRLWLFITRTALPVRAPSFVS